MDSCLLPPSGPLSALSSLLPPSLHCHRDACGSLWFCVNSFLVGCSKFTELTLFDYKACPGVFGWWALSDVRKGKDKKY